jgi:hypothetical protein
MVPMPENRKTPRAADLKPQATNQSAIDMQPQKAAVVGMIAGFNVSPERILRNERGTQV